MVRHGSRFYVLCEQFASQVSALALIQFRSDEDYFRQTTGTRPGVQPSENWVLRFSSLKRLYRLMTQYFSDVLHQPTSAIEVPDLQSIAKDYNLTPTLIMCRLTIAIAVQCEKNKDVIEKIQRLSESEQHTLMRVIEEVSHK